MHSLLLLFVVVLTSLPPAAKALAVMGVVYGIIQGLKQAPWFTPYLKGWMAIAVNVVLTSLGLLVTIPADQLYTTATGMALLTAVLGAAGIHGTVSNIASQTQSGPVPPNSPSNVPVSKIVATLFLALLLPLTVVGCVNKNTPLPTGAINATDAQLNANLQAAHAALVQYTSDVAAGKHIPDPTEKAIVNKVIVSLNTADLLYCGAPTVNDPCAPTSYHALLLANPNAGEPQALINAVVTVTSNLGALQALVTAVK